MEDIMCERCILDTRDDPFISFDDFGICNYCRNFEEVQKVAIAKQELGINNIISKIKASGSGSKYDCIIGLSGGVDSSYVALLCKEHGLNPLGVHLDNGWNSELAVSNIHNIVSKLNIDLYTHVIDWEEFKDLQRSFFKANVVDIELLTDHAIIAVLRSQALKNNIKYILHGINTSTEAILPKWWIHDKSDALNIKGIHGRYGTQKIKTFPYLPFFKNYFIQKFDRVRLIALLDYIKYDKAEAKNRIIKELEWRDYGGKHYESIFTRFYQAYILPKKFGIDKRKAHLSSLICSGQISKEEALMEMKEELYPPDKLKSDYEYVLKKLDYTDKEFKDYLKEPRVEHTYYPSYTTKHNMLLDKLSKLFAPLKKLFAK